MCRRAQGWRLAFYQTAGEIDSRVLGCANRAPLLHSLQVWVNGLGLHPMMEKGRLVPVLGWCLPCLISWRGESHSLTCEPPGRQPVQSVPAQGPQAPVVGLAPLWESQSDAFAWDTEHGGHALSPTAPSRQWGRNFGRVTVDLFALEASTHWPLWFSFAEPVEPGRASPSLAGPTSVCLPFIATASTDTAQDRWVQPHCAADCLLLPWERMVHFLSSLSAVPWALLHRQDLLSQLAVWGRVFGTPIHSTYSCTSGFEGRSCSWHLQPPGHLDAPLHVSTGSMWPPPSGGDHCPVRPLAVISKWVALPCYFAGLNHPGISYRL